MSCPFGEIAERLLAATREDGGEFVWDVLGDHLEEIGEPEFARMIRDGDYFLFRDIMDFLAGIEFDPARHRLHVVRRRWKGFPKPAREWVRRKTFLDRRGHWSCRVGIYSPNPTPLFDHQFAWALED